VNLCETVERGFVQSSDYRPVAPSGDATNSIKVLQTV